MSTVPQKVLNQYISEGNSYTYNWKYSSSLTGETISFIFRQEDATGTGAVLATANGTGANVAQSIALNYGAYGTGTYLLEVYKAYGASGETLLYPPDNVKQRIIIQERFGT